VNLPRFTRFLSGCADLRYLLVFSGDYRENATRDLGVEIAQQDAIAEHYDYDSDSDLEDAADLNAAERSDDGPASSGLQATIRYSYIFATLLDF
jgi:hypothetical protein